MQTTKTITTKTVFSESDIIEALSKAHNISTSDVKWELQYVNGDKQNKKHQMCVVSSVVDEVDEGDLMW